ncbi:MAG: penicillin-binding protein 2 [Desulfobacteraceae bacterium]|nr:penicillin-binding protein 2 [Desulfobacteraceae bacterium]MDH3572077.1 penicillin-binding protein 2 [Desulfobacteraceae bacterium]MDH3721215.1 penicillin-binding protein 2 [Desulfobacteraceae bacterium]MDH3838378.1 penicillin-binding protein 2 [Desulfobacteraceae bacterium]MDH3872670.1 penicillin-binding protein 2 [Desulfobacteraceae bacterium]
MKQIKLRVIIIGALFTVFFIIIGVKAMYLQVFRGSWLSQKAADQYEVSFKSSGKRGTIFDRNLREMAVSIDVTSIAAHPSQIEHPKSAARSLSKALKIDRKALAKKLNSKKKFVWIKRKVTPKEAEAVKKLNMEGLDFILEHKRFFPNKTLAAQLIGFTDIDDHGLEGIEFNYDDDLSGDMFQYTVLRDAHGRGFEAENMTGLSSAGKNLVLTVDSTIQYIAEKALAETVKEFSAKSGMAIVMVPKTGAILALAQVPLFNPNALKRSHRKFWRNRIITDPFEPGSTMKIFSAAAAIESGSSSPSSIFFCENGAYKMGRHVIHDTHEHGWLSLQQIIKYSSNIGAIKFSAIMGHEYLSRTLQNFGFGSKTGIDCPGETAGSLPPFKRWTKVDAGTISFGQGVSVSALQLIVATSAVANKGILMKPYVVQAITDHNGRLIESFGPRRIRRVISEKTAGTLSRIMQTVITEGGTGVNAALEGYSVCGKTGTAQKIDENGRYSYDKYVASFVGFAPVENPKIAVLVVVDEPEKQHYGSIVAAPAFKAIAQKTLDYMHIAPKRKTDKLMVSLRR